jgi:acyl dehydratase
MTARRPADVVPGDALPKLVFDATLTALVAYGAATWDFHRVHYDTAFAAEAGFGAPIMDGQMVGALLARQLMQWGGPDAFLRRLAFRQRAPVFAGDRIIVTGSVTAISDGLVLCGMDVSKLDGTAVVRGATGAVELADPSR